MRRNITANGIYCLHNFALGNKEYEAIVSETELSRDTEIIISGPDNAREFVVSASTKVIGDCAFQGYKRLEENWKRRLPENGHSVNLHSW